MMFHLHNIMIFVLLQEMKDVQEWLDKTLPPTGGNM